MLRRAPVFLLIAGCATEAAVEPVTPSPPRVVVDDAPRAPEPETREPTAEEAREPEANTDGDEASASDSDEAGMGKARTGESETREGGIGLGNIGTIGIGGTGSGQGFGIGSGRLGRATQGAMNVNGPLDKEIIRRMIRREIGAIRACYERELLKQPKLQGRLVVRFVIEPDGSVSEARAETSLDPNVDTCVLARFQRMTFPKPDGGSVVVRYPVIFQPAETK